jgi:hypothetical protein
MMRVTTGAAPSPVRRTDDAFRDAEVMRRIRAGDRRPVDDLYQRFAVRRSHWPRTSSARCSWACGAIRPPSTGAGS